MNHLGIKTASIDLRKRNLSPITYVSPEHMNQLALVLEQCNSLLSLFFDKLYEVVIHTDIELY